MTPSDGKPVDAHYEQVVPGGPYDRFQERMLVLGVALVVSLLVGLATSLYIVNTVQDGVTKQVQKATQSGVQRNCDTQHAGRDSGNRLRFALRELLAFDTDIISTTTHNPKQTAEQRRGLAEFLARERTRLLADLKIARKDTPGLPNIASYGDLLPLLANIPNISCNPAVLFR